MRITAGIHRGRQLRAPLGLDTRPTSDRAREALFNILAHRDFGEEIGDPLRGKAVLDGFAGTGALGLEALSRGAALATFIEKDREALKTLRQNIGLLHCEDESFVFGLDITRIASRESTQPATLVFLDPPYKKNLIPPALKTLEEHDFIAKHALLVLETSKSETLELDERYTHQLTRSYGETTIHFYVK